jgi:predicted nucleic acid-binding protein
MRIGSAAFLVDTNVLVYSYDRSDGTKRERSRLTLEELRARRLGALSVQVLGEFFNAVTRRIPSPLSTAEAEASVLNYVRSWPVLELTEVTVREAVRCARLHRLAYWDSLIWATAMLGGIPTILSEDFSDGRVLEGVRFLNPFSESFAVASLA